MKAGILHDHEEAGIADGGAAPVDRTGVAADKRRTDHSLDRALAEAVEGVQSHVVADGGH